MPGQVFFEEKNKVTDIVDPRWEPTRERGRIKFYLADKRYGFIATRTGRDMFVHVSQIDFPETEIRNEMEVTFERGEHGGRPCAERVRKP